MPGSLPPQQISNDFRKSIAESPVSCGIQMHAVLAGLRGQRRIDEGMVTPAPSGLQQICPSAGA